MVRRTTRVMSCEATVLAYGDDGSALGGLTEAAIRRRLHQLEARWSRFVPTTELSRLNARQGEAVRVSPDTVRLVTALVQGWYLTDEAFDPTLLGALVELGYAYSRDDLWRRTSLVPTTDRRGRPDAVLIDPVHGVVQLPAGTALDPGGLGKGLAADIVVDELLADGATGALVEIGGDLRVGGEPPDRGWTIAVDTARPSGPALVSVPAGGVATSTSRLRTWTVDGEHRHHLIDPATLRPSTGDAVSCTVLAGTAAWADAFTKVAFARPAPEAIAIYETHRLAASITTASGRRLTTPNWEAYAMVTAS